MSSKRYDFLRPMLSRRSFFVASVLLCASCTDPVHDDAVAALGDERRGVRPGATHRPGQPCLTCHGPQGPGSPELSIAGTVYSARGVQEPLSSVLVVLTDANQSTRTVVSNEVGNFYVASLSWTPTYPVSVELQDPRADNGGVKSMVTQIGRSGSCATCHYGADDDPKHMPPVFLRLKAL